MYLSSIALDQDLKFAFMAENFEMNFGSKTVILCADDYGISPGVNQAINQLAENNRISATSVMVCFDNWQFEASRLLELKNRLDIGLHFVLTDFNPVSPIETVRTLVNSNGKFHRVNRLIENSFFQRIDPKEIMKEFCAQLERFTDFFRIEPDYVDGHHNVHQYPEVREIVISFLAKNNPQYPQYVRNTFIQLKRIFKQDRDFIKSGFISFWGGRLKKMAQASKVPTNLSFSGVYDLTQSSRFAIKMARFLELSHESNGIIMTHPGFPDETLARRDAFCQGRQKEFDFLMSSEFLEICQERNVFLGRFNSNP